MLIFVTFLLMSTARAVVEESGAASSLDLPDEMLEQASKRPRNGVGTEAALGGLHQLTKLILLNLSFNNLSGKHHLIHW